MPNYPVIEPTALEAKTIVAILAKRHGAGALLCPGAIGREFAIDNKTARLLIDIAAGKPQEGKR